MITPAFSLTATERVLPKLALDFTSGSLDPRITFSRGSSATRFDNTGTLVTMTNNQPRFDYDPVTLLPKGLLIEEQRANLLTYSDQFNDVSWSKAGATVLTDSIVAPSGTTSGDKLVEDAVTSSHVVGKTISGLSGATGSFSVFLKAGERTFALVGSTLGHIAVNLVTGQIINSFGSPVNTQSVSVGNGWWRVSFSGTPAITDGNNIFVYTSQDGVFANRSYAGDGTSGIYIWGAQLEAGAFPTSYIPTTTTALTRNADVATMTGTNFSDWWQSGSNPSFVCSYIQQAPYNLGTVEIFKMTSGSDANYYRLYTSTTGVGGRYVQISNNVATCDTYSNSVLTQGNTYTYAVGSRQTSTTFCRNGDTTISSNLNTGALPLNINNIQFGRFGSVWLRKFEYIPQRLINNEVLTFSKG